MAVDFEFKDKYNIEDLISLVTLLRAPGGCPWDREQTHESIKKNFIEETYEVIEAINKNSSDGLKEELGDILLQVAMHSEMEREAGSFDFSDVCDDICKKLIVRHPHVFGDVVAKDTDQALSSWDAVKQSIKGVKKQSETMDSIPLELPALMRAQKVQGKASKFLFDCIDCDGAFDKLFEQVNELKFAFDQSNQSDIEGKLGDLLFSCVNIARFSKIDSEEALKSTTDKFINQFKATEQLAEEKGVSVKDCSFEELGDLWNKAKEILAV